MIGVDFDNTIVCYDVIFHRACLERGLIPATVAENKSAVRNFLREAGREDDWTEMQGVVYGSRMAEAEAYPGVIDFFRECRRRRIPLAIVSHKTRYPYAGERYDIHAAATEWLEAQRFFDASYIGLSRDRVFFELTKESKLARIGSLGCTMFIDDLPEILQDPRFPSAVERVLFDPGALYHHTPLRRISSWAEARQLLID